MSHPWRWNSHRWRVTGPIHRLVHQDRRKNLHLGTISDRWWRHFQTLLWIVARKWIDRQKNSARWRQGWRRRWPGRKDDKAIGARCLLHLSTFEHKSWLTRVHNQHFEIMWCNNPETVHPGPYAVMTMVAMKTVALRVKMRWRGVDINMLPRNVWPETVGTLTSLVLR